MNAKYLVYCHIRPDTNQVFYIGKGTKKRMRDKSNRSRYWHNIVNKAGGYVAKIIAANLYEKEALSFEKLMISKLRDIGEALCNLTEGGDGVSGYQHTEETRRKFSERMKGKPSPTLGMKFSDEHKQKIRMAKLGKKQTEEHRLAAIKGRLGMKPSDETKRRIAASNTGKKHTPETLKKLSKPVICLTTGKFYNSIKEAAIELSLQTTNISKVCLGRFSQTKGYKFQYAQGITS